jgi:hypothetical protein
MKKSRFTEQLSQLSSTSSLQLHNAKGRLSLHSDGLLNLASRRGTKLSPVSFKGKQSAI